MTLPCSPPLCLFTLTFILRSHNTYNAYTWSRRFYRFLIQVFTRMLQQYHFQKLLHCQHQLPSGKCIDIKHSAHGDPSSIPDSRSFANLSPPLQISNLIKSDKIRCHWQKCFFSHSSILNLY